MTRRNLFRSLLAPAVTLMLATGALAANWSWGPFQYGYGIQGEPSGVQYRLGERSNGAQNRIKFRNKNNKPVSVHCLVGIQRPNLNVLSVVQIHIPKLKKNKVSAPVELGPGEVKKIAVYSDDPY